MRKVTHYMVHCADTPEGMYFNGNSILQWHCLPFRMSDGTVKYKSKIYKSVDDLPYETMGGLLVRKNFGSHGWSRPGYDKVMLLDGTWDEIWPNNDDGIMDDFEVTNGILSSSPLYRTTIHRCYIGGRGKDGKPKDTRTILQLEAWEEEIKKMIELIPDLKIIGHNQENDRACPSFNLPKWLRSIDIDEKNISKAPIVYKGILT